MLNEAFPVFLTLQSHFHSHKHLPMRLQLLVAHDLSPAQHDMFNKTITPHAQLLSQRPAGVQGICFRQLLVGDGGYRATSKASLTLTVANRRNTHGAQYAKEPSFFSSANWWAFRQHVMQVRICIGASQLLCDTLCQVMLCSYAHYAIRQQLQSVSSCGGWQGRTLRSTTKLGDHVVGCVTQRYWGVKWWAVW
jgi:hypothetical protein